METNSLASEYCRATNFVGIMTLLANSSCVADSLNKYFGRVTGPEAIKMLRSGILTGEIGCNTQDFLEEEIATKAKLVWKGTIYDPSDVEDLDRQFPVQVLGYERVFFVRSLEFDDVGYFTSEKDAIAYVHMNWTDVLDG